MSHTPGPWYVSPVRHRVGAIIGPTRVRVLVADCPPHLALRLDGAPHGLAPEEIGLPMAFANAHLIAAAPELLEACKAVLHHPDLIYTGCDHEPLDTCGLGGLIPLRDQLRAAIAKAEGK
jgi:hypothetical protein